MKIVSIEDLHCDAGWRNFSFLKVTTDTGLVGWSEYNESFGSQGLSELIRRLGAALIGQNPLHVGRAGADLYRMTRTAPGGPHQQAIAAIEHALLDITGKAFGAPVSALFGGPYRDRIPVYWSHCGTFRVNHAEAIGAPPIRSLADLRDVGREVAARGYRALKTNLIRFDGGRGPWLHGLDQTHDDGSRHPEANVSREIIDMIHDQMTALREGAGPGVGLMLDLNFFFKPEALIRIGREMARHDLIWLECDSLNAGAMAHLRNNVPVAIASCEAVYGQEALVPFFEQRAMDVCVYDVVWQGFLEGVRIAAMADAFAVNVAPHNMFGPLGNAIAAHFSAVIPNLRMMEMDVDSVPWHDAILVEHPRIEGGVYYVPQGPGWGVEVDERVIRAHPPRRAAFEGNARPSGTGAPAVL
jgi:L-alanine-DL-glutamate epimerase-like enolase superfamily enzyme